LGLETGLKTGSKRSLHVQKLPFFVSQKQKRNFRDFVKRIKPASLEKYANSDPERVFLRLQRRENAPDAAAYGDKVLIAYTAAAAFSLLLSSLTTIFSLPFLSFKTYWFLEAKFPQKRENGLIKTRLHCYLLKLTDLWSSSGIIDQSGQNSANFWRGAGRPSDQLHNQVYNEGVFGFWW
jgi:hypothetical protein